MQKSDLLVERFECHRSQLIALAYRMLGSLCEAEDAVQEAWIRLSRSDPAEVENLGGWLTTVVARICLDGLRSRKSRKEDSLELSVPEIRTALSNLRNQESEVIMADSVGLALLITMDRLAPAERLAFVLHDCFGMSFDEIAPIVDRSTVAAKKLASRARARIHGDEPRIRPDERHRQREVADSFLRASRAGDVKALIAILDPDVVRRADRNALPPGAAVVVEGASDVSSETAMNSGLAHLARVAYVDGGVGLVVAFGRKLKIAIRLTIHNDKIKEIDVIADPARLRLIKLAVLKD